MASIEKRNDGTETAYRVKIRLKGYPTQTATFARLTDARKWAHATEAAIREGRHFKTIESKKHTLGEMIDRFLAGAELTQVQDGHVGTHLRRWKDEIGYLLLSDVSADVITKVKDKLLNEQTRTGKKRSATTVLRYLTSLSTAFTTATNDWKWLEDSPMRTLKKPKSARGRVRFLDDDERQRLLTACKESKNAWLYPCVILALSSGMRQGELMGLKWQNVNLKDGYLILHETKNGDRRRVPLSGLALSLLQEHAKVRRLDTQLLFPSNKDAQKPIDLRKPFETALKAAAINDFHWHDLRHCTASYLAMNGASLAEIAEILGHKTLQMVKRYAHLSDGHVSNVVASMNQKIFGG
ncbi:MAG: site-specific integrase [Methylobacter sp.]|nr:site-specific integrase [Methylobacter sp.]